METTKHRYVILAGRNGKRLRKCQEKRRNDRVRNNAEKDTAGTSSAASMAADEGVVKNEESGETASVPPAPQVQQNDMQGGYTQQQEYAEQQLPSYGHYNQQYSHQQQDISRMITDNVYRRHLKRRERVCF